MGKKTYNPEKRAWKGKSYKKTGRRIKDLKERNAPDQVPSKVVPPP